MTKENWKTGQRGRFAFRVILMYERPGHPGVYRAYPDVENISSYDENTDLPYGEGLTPLIAIGVLCEHEALSQIFSDTRFPSNEHKCWEG